MEQNKEFKSKVKNAQKLVDSIEYGVQILSIATNDELQILDTVKNTTGRVVFELAQQLGALFGKMPTTEDLRVANKTSIHYFRLLEELKVHLDVAIDFESCTIVDDSELISARDVLEEFEGEL